MAHRWVIRKDRVGQFRASFEYNSERIWWTEGYSTKAAALGAIDSAKKNAPSAPLEFQPPPDELDQFRNAVVPPSNQVVAPDHNSAEYRAFEKALVAFSEKVRTANNLFALDFDDLEIARAEFAQLKDASSKRAFRAEALWNMTKTTSFWIAEKAADGAVKALAVGLLAAAAKLLGVVVF